MRLDLGRLLTLTVLLSAGVSIMRAIDPPWPLWQGVLAGVGLSLAAYVGLERLRRSL